MTHPEALLASNQLVGLSLDRRLLRALALDKLLLQLQDLVIEFVPLTCATGRV